MTDILYQTLEDRNNPDEVEQHGPYKCTRSDAWLGHGYYFWHHFIGFAHRWGKVAYADNYMICSQTGFVYGNPEVLDLVGDLLMIDVIDQYTTSLKKAYNQESMLVHTVLEHMKSIGALTNYKAVRIEGRESMMGSYNVRSHRLPFKKGEDSYFEMKPPVQVCVYDKSILDNDFRVIYPDEYNLVYGS